MISTTSSCSRNSMEDVWKDISLASLSHNPCNNTTTSTHHPAAAAFQGIMFQDFLASTSTTSSNIDSPPPAAASTVLLLNSGTQSDLEQKLLETTITTITGPPPLMPNPITHPTSTSVTTTRPNCLDNPSSVFPSCYKKRALDDHDHNHENHHNSTNGSRHKRMMKNRESAARSRARKQAYTNELELEIAHLREENARLKKQLQAKMMINSSYLAAPTLAPQLLPKRQTLFRTSTAPF